MTAEFRNFDARYRVNKGWLKLLQLECKSKGLPTSTFFSQFDCDELAKLRYDIRHVRQFQDFIIEQSGTTINNASAATHLAPLTFGCFSVCLFTARTLLDILRLFESSSICLTNQVNLYIEETSNNIDLWVLDISSPDVYKATSHGFFFLFSVIIESLYKANNNQTIPFELHVKENEYSEDELIHIKERYKCTKIEIGSVRKISFNKISLTNETTGFCRETYEHNLNYIDQLARKLNNSDIRQQVLSLFDEHETLRDVTLDYVAKQLATTARTLNRRLLSSGTSFKSLLQSYRTQKAISLLSIAEVNNTEVAYQLGFSELSSFSRAFKSWTGYPPSYYRAKSTF